MYIYRPLTFYIIPNFEEAGAEADEGAEAPAAHPQAGSGL